MNVLRTYTLSGDVLKCVVDFPEMDGMLPYYEASGSIRLSMIVGPSARQKDDLKVYSVGCSRSVVLDEIIRFVQIVKQMYQL